MIAGGAATAGNGQQQQQQQRSRCLIYLNDIEACAQCVQRLKTELAKEVAEGFEVRMRAHRIVQPFELCCRHYCNQSDATSVHAHNKPVLPVVCVGRSCKYNGADITQLAIRVVQQGLK
jgi:hypothetical protein